MKNEASQTENPQSFVEEIASLKATVAKQALLIEYYESQLLQAKRRQFGSSSEKSDADDRQLNLFAEAEVIPVPSGETEEIHYKRKKRKGKREEDLSGLPVERIDYELPESERACPQCGETMRDIGVDIRRELELIPAQVIVVEHAAHAYACKQCGKNGEATPILKAKAPAPLISGSLASSSLVSHIAVQKYMNAMPLYRMEKGFAYDGVTISRQNMANWVIACSLNYLVAIYMLLRGFLLKESVIHSDETTLQVLREPGRAAQSKSYEWIYRTSGCAQHKIVIYDYQQTREQEHPQEFLKEFKGFLHTDGYQAYHNLPSEITVVGCWAHVRRKWEYLYKTIPKEKRKDSSAGQAMAYINALFSLEREFADLSPQERYEKRLEKSKPIADTFFAWAQGLNALPKGPLGQPVSYMMSQRAFLYNVFLDGRVELSNNRAERSVKPFVIGRKNWLFANTPDGASASSIMYSIIETAKENGLHPQRYIEFLLKVLPNSTTCGLENLLPWSLALPDYCRV